MAPTRRNLRSLEGGGWWDDALKAAALRASVAADAASKWWRGEEPLTTESITYATNALKYMRENEEFRLEGVFRLSPDNTVMQRLKVDGIVDAVDVTFIERGSLVKFVVQTLCADNLVTIVPSGNSLFHIKTERADVRILITNFLAVVLEVMMNVATSLMGPEAIAAILAGLIPAPVAIKADIQAVMAWLSSTRASIQHWLQELVDHITQCRQQRAEAEARAAQIVEAGVGRATI